MTVARATNGSYIIQLDSSRMLPQLRAAFFPAAYNCLNLAFGPLDQASALALLPPPNHSNGMPQYASTLGFYSILGFRP
jgi:hypothetical protein